MTKYPEVGTVITLKVPVSAYGHGYAMTPEGLLLDCILQPEDTATVKQSKCVAVRGKIPYFTLVTFERSGQIHTAAVWPGEFRALKPGQFMEGKVIRTRCKYCGAVKQGGKCPVGCKAPKSEYLR